MTQLFCFRHFTCRVLVTSSSTFHQLTHIILSNISNPAISTLHKEPQMMGNQPTGNIVMNDPSACQQTFYLRGPPENSMGMSVRWVSFTITVIIMDLYLLLTVEFSIKFIVQLTDLTRCWWDTISAMFSTQSIEFFAVTPTDFEIHYDMLKILDSFGQF